MPPHDPEQARWFSEEVYPCEPLLRASLRHKFPSLSDIDDVVQESYLRLLRARVNGTIRSVRGFLFTTAHNIAYDLFRRKQTAAVAPDFDVDTLISSEGRGGLPEAVSRDQELRLLADAIEALPNRCREILKLRKIAGLSHKEIAERLGISVRTVNVQIGIGVQRCAEFLQQRTDQSGDT